MSLSYIMVASAYTELSDSRHMLDENTMKDHCYANSCGSTSSTVAPSDVSSTHSSSPRQAQKLESVEHEACEALARRSSLAMSLEIAEGPLQDMFADSDTDCAYPTSPSKSARRRLRRRRQRDALRAVAAGRGMGLSLQAEHVEGPCSPAAALGKLGFEVETKLHRSIALDASSEGLATEMPSLCKAPIVARNSLTATPVRTAVMSTCPSSPGSVASPSADASMRHVPPKTPMSTCPCSPTSLDSPSADASMRPVPPKTLVNANCGGSMTHLGAAHMCMVAISPTAPILPPNAATSVALDRTVTPVVAEPPSTPVTNNGSPNNANSPSPEVLKMLAGVLHVPTWGEIAYKLQTAAPEVYED